MLAPLALLVAPKPNIVVILADDLGYSDLGCYGSEIRTPNLDTLRKRGVALAQFYNQARCCPTRAALLTGRYPHQVGIGEMIDDYAAAARRAADSPAYQDHLSRESPTVAELLREAGYHTMMVGKWHLGKRPEEWPAHRGFDRSFVQINGAMNYYGGDSKEGPRTPMALNDKPFVPPKDGFYSTEAFTDRAIEFLGEAKRLGKPFFLYLPYNATHWPLQAPESEIVKYKGVYDRGFQEIRVDRLKRMKELGLVPRDAHMARMDRGAAQPWDRMPSERRKEWARRMEVYAAQTTLLDRGVGRVVDELKRLGVDRNTLVVFLSDNGGAAEDPNGGDRSAAIGGRDSYRGYGRPWASVSNTPWKRHKVTAYEGGISTPFIAAWPEGIAAQAAYVRTPAHVIDLVPTLLAIAQGDASSAKPEGKNILSLLRGEEDAGGRIFGWEHEGNRAIRKGQWKLVAGAGEPWHLYDVETDRLEANDLAPRRPEKVAELTRDYEAWAKRCGVIPRAELETRMKEKG